MASDSAPPAPGAKKPVRIGKYEVLEHIANGGMGAVYRARDTEAKRDVAIKILLPELAAKKAMEVRFRREYAAASKLRHENIVALYDLGEAGNTLYFAMELVEGIDLHEHIQKKERLDPEEARLIILQAARALRHANAHGIVHRDIKPSNFLLTRKAGRLQVKLTDFGLAREVSENEFRVTRAGTTVGTIDYMSPEQAKDSGAADIRSDLYSLGSTWYHLLVGHCPFPEGGLGERLIKIMSQIPPDARELNPLVSDDTWTIVEKLLAKSPKDRYQTPEELIGDLLPLEGKATAKPRSRPALRKKPKKKSRSSGETEAGQATQSDASPGTGIYIAMGVTAAVMLAAACLFFLPRRTKPQVPDTPPPPPFVVNTDDKGKKVDDPPKAGGKGKEPDQPGTPVAKLPALYRWPDKSSLAQLRDEVNKPWAKQAEATGKVLRVRRAPGVGEYATLAAAAAAGADIIEIADNGPLFELPVTVTGRSLTIRAARGYRPLVVWDLAATQQRRRAEGKLDEPLSFLRCKAGSLAMEEIEIVWKWPDSLAASGTLVAVEGGGLKLSGCAFSGVGRPRGTLVLARVKNEKPGTRIRLDRCQLRGQGLSALDLDAPGAEVLMDGCLLAGQGPMIRIRAGEMPTTRLRMVRSTLTAAGSMVELRPRTRGELRPALSVLAWDSLLTRSRGEGELLAITDGAGPGSVEWKGVNALYAGWDKLLASGPASATSIEDWRRQWIVAEGDGLRRDAWPVLPAEEPGLRPATAFLPTGKMAFGATTDPDRPLGCDLQALPTSRNDWLSLAFEPVSSTLEPITDATPPEIPSPGDRLFHGASVDLDEIDLGAYLARRKLGPRVVMHLTGNGPRTTSPIRIKGSTLVLHFQQPEEKGAARLALVAGFTAAPAPLLSVEGGGLVIIDGVLRSPDARGVKVTHLVSVLGGAVEMYRTRLEGPRLAVPDGYQGALLIHGSGQPDKPLAATLNECVVLSSQEGVRLADPGVNLLMRQCLIVAGKEALALIPGAGCKGRAGMQAILENCTLAARRAAFRLGDLAEAVVPPSPVRLKTKDCAILDPFPHKSDRGGLLVYEGEGLSRGLLTWQSERDGFDSRLWFVARQADGATPEVKMPKDALARLLGSPGMLSPRPALPASLKVFDARSWDLNRLALPVRGLGADLPRLGISKKK